MKIKRFDFNFKPLQLNVCMAVEGSVPDVQTYNADDGTYTPDYSITPLIIQPAVSQLDKDEIVSAGRINQSLANVRWYEVVDDERRQISTADENFEIVTSGGNAGRLKVKKNAQPQLPLNLVFYAEYTDPRTKQLFTIWRTVQILCRNATVYMPRLVLDAADQTIYNPLGDQAKQTVHANLRVGKDECPTENRLFVWEIFRDDNTWTEVGEDTTLDYDVTISEDGASVTVDRSIMGQELYLRCRAKYDINGNPGSVELNDNSPQKIIAFVRRIPKFEYDIFGVPTNIPPGLLAIAPEAKIWATNGEIEDPERELIIIWSVATNKQSGSLSYEMVGQGLNPTLPTARMSEQYGGVYGVDVIDAGPTCAWEDSDGAVFEDGDGNVILIK